MRRGTIVALLNRKGGVQVGMSGDGVFYALPVQGGRFRFEEPPPPDYAPSPSLAGVPTPSGGTHALLTTPVEKVVEARPGYVLFRTDSVVYMLFYKEVS